MCHPILISISHCIQNYTQHELRFLAGERVPRSASVPFVHAHRRSRCSTNQDLYSLRVYKKLYYEMLEINNKNLKIDGWIEYFSDLILTSLNYSQNKIEFLIEKTKLYDKFREKLNLRQEKAIARIFKEGIEGFCGGLSADNYISITKTSRATATRDLQDLVEKGVCIKTGELKSTRYFLNIKTKCIT